MGIQVTEDFQKNCRSKLEKGNKVKLLKFKTLSFELLTSTETRLWFQELIMKSFGFGFTLLMLVCPKLFFCKQLSLEVNK